MQHRAGARAGRRPGASSRSPRPGVNFIDVYQREGIYPTPPPFVLGGECAGTGRGGRAGGRASSPSATWSRPAAAASGGHAALRLIDADRPCRCRTGVDPKSAAAAMLQGMTAHYLVHVDLSACGAGDEVLVHAAAGGVGQLLVQLAKARGAHVVGDRRQRGEGRRSPGRSARTRSSATTRSTTWPRAVRDASGGGVHVAYDGVGKATFDASLASLRRRGTLALFGAASGPVPPVDPQRLNSGGSLFLTRPTLAHYIADRDELLLARPPKC